MKDIIRTFQYTGILENGHDKEEGQQGHIPGYNKHMSTVLCLGLWVANMHIDHRSGQLGPVAGVGGWWTGDSDNDDDG